MRLGRTVLLVSALLVRASASHADDKADKVEAEKHYQLGKRHYNLNEWDDAIAEFKTAYKLFPDPVNLYNIAQAYRLKKGHCADAATFYANYQREEKIKKLRDSVTKVRKDMEACAKTEKPDEPPPVQPTVPPVGPAIPPVISPPPIRPPLPPPTGDNAMRSNEPPAVNADPNRNRRILGFVLIGTGVVSTFVAILYSAKISSLERRLDGCDDFGCDDGSDPIDLREERNRAEVSANSGYAYGIPAIILGSILYAVSRKPKPTDKSKLTIGRAAIRPMRGGAAFSWSF